jgi:mRNA interferase RelE/StbE
VKVAFRESFSKNLAGIKDRSLLSRLKATIEAIEKAGSLDQINGLKKMKGGGNYFRPRIWDFRVGMTVEGDKIVFVRFITPV